MARTTKKIEIEKIVAKYIQKEMVSLVRKDLEVHGYKVENIRDLTEIEIYIEDDRQLLLQTV